MTDDFKRDISYLRVSITDRCNLRCRYCMPEDLPLIDHDNILRYEEILRICSVMASLGIRHIRVTGGEPLVRQGCIDFIEKLADINGIESVSLTTNGTLLMPYIDRLAKVGLGSVNISLDTLLGDVYKSVTGQDMLSRVLKSIEAALFAGLHVKINCVPMENVNSDGLCGLAALAQRMPVDVRFIELMPTDAGEALHRMSGEEVREILRDEYPDLAKVNEVRGHGPAVYWTSSRLLGRIGFIDAVSEHFCSSCNRIRLTSEGFLKLCLYHKSGVSLRDLIRGGIDDKELSQIIKAAIKDKPKRHNFGERSATGGIIRMSGIGG